MNRTIKNCPCCKGKATIKRNGNDVGTMFYADFRHYIECNDCGLRTKQGELNTVINLWNRTAEDRDA